MGSYLGKHAEYYDIFYKDKPYAREAAYIDNLLRQNCPGACRQLLELACGTGRHAFELEKLGYEVVAIDYSADLLNIARRSAKKENSSVEFDLQDMRVFSLPGRIFDSAYCLFDSIGYVKTNFAIGQVLDRVHAHLKAQGLFIFEFWHAAAMLKFFEPIRERHWQTDRGELIRIAHTRLDIPKQLAEVVYTITEQFDGQSHQIEETQTNRYFLVQEMSSYLENHHFKPLIFLPAYQEKTLIDESTWHVLSIAQKVDK